MSSKKTYRITLQGSDGKPYTISYEGLWQQIKDTIMTYDEKRGWNGVTRSLREDLNTLRELMLDEILIPKAKHVVLEFLKENPNVETRKFHHKDWMIGERSWAWYQAKLQLEEQKIIISTSHGKGKNRTWNLNQHCLK